MGRPEILIAGLTQKSSRKTKIKPKVAGAKPGLGSLSTGPTNLPVCIRRPE